MRAPRTNDGALNTTCSRKPPWRELWGKFDLLLGRFSRECTTAIPLPDYRMFENLPKKRYNLPQSSLQSGVVFSVTLPLSAPVRWSTAPGRFRSHRAVNRVSTLYGQSAHRGLACRVPCEPGEADVAHELARRFQRLDDHERPPVALLGVVPRRRHRFPVFGRGGASSEAACLPKWGDERRRFECPPPAAASWSCCCISFSVPPPTVSSVPPLQKALPRGGFK